MKVKTIVSLMILVLLCYPLIVEGALDVKGVAYMSRSQESAVDDPNAFLTEASDESLVNLRFTGTNYVALVITQYMSGGISNSIYPKPNRTATDAAIIHAIDKIHQLGMNVMIKPHIDCEDGTWRGWIDPQDKNAWFNSYDSFINHYAQIAQDNYQAGDIFCVGTELKSMSKDYNSQWTTIINNIKSNFSGPLIYSANWNEYPDVSFWNQLDYVGIDAYFSLTDSEDPPLQEIIDGWSYYNGDAQYVYDKPRHWLQEIETWQAGINKPIIFTEIGYRSRDYAAMEPWNWEDGADYNGKLQARCYEAIIQVFKDKDWFKGLFFWCWFTNPDAGGFGTTGYSPQNKPAENTLTIWFEGGKDYAYDFENGTTQEWINDISLDFVDNLGTPFNSTDEAHRMTHSLAFHLNLDNKDPVYGSINDTAYVQFSTPKNLYSYYGISTYVFIPESANIPNTSKAMASIFIKTGTDWDWFESNYMTDIILGNWNKIELKFSLARDKDGNTNQRVTNEQEVYQLGIHISGASSGTGNTLFYIDSVEFEGTSSAADITVIVQGVTIGVSITSSYDFGLVQMGDEVVSTTPLIVTNTGTTSETYSLSLVNPSGWTAVQTNPGNETYVLNAMFNSGLPSQISFEEVKHTLSTEQTQCSSIKFAGNQTGVAIPETPGSNTRDLWLEFRAPVMTAETMQQIIKLIVSAEMS